jgi:hypothetical protein
MWPFTATLFSEGGKNGQVKIKNSDPANASHKKRSVLLNSTAHLINGPFRVLPFEVPSSADRLSEKGIFTPSKPLFSGRL